LIGRRSKAKSQELQISSVFNRKKIRGRGI
jgi:hypothetical protein